VLCSATFSIVAADEIQNGLVDGGGAPRSNSAGMSVDDIIDDISDDITLSRSIRLD
jgi:hypothetical protein